MKTAETTRDADRRHLPVEWMSQQWSVPLNVPASRRLNRNLRGRARLCSGFREVRSDLLRVSSRRAFTLIELLVVIAIIAILAGLLLPVLSKVQERGRITQARTEMQSLVAAISSYESDYSTYPLANPAITSDTTYTNNSEIMVMLLDVDTSGDSAPRLNWNLNSARNPRHIVYLQVKQAKSGFGAGLDGSTVLNDPWGTPYEITMDIDGDNKCPDPRDGSALISRPVLVRSYGPDRMPDPDIDDPDSDDIDSWR